MSEIVAIVSDFGKEPSALFTFHANYYAPAVDKYLLVTHADESDVGRWRELVATLGNVTAIPKADLPRFVEGGNNRFDARKDHYEEKALECLRIADAFVLHLDLDEFHVYPAPIREIVQRMTEEREPAVLGYFRDRLKLNVDKTTVLLDAIDPAADLGCQFPFCATYARDMMNPDPCEEKIMVARRDIRLGHGRHHIINSSGQRDGARTKQAECWSKLGPWGGDHFYVHHFHWTSHLRNISSRALTEPEYSPRYIDEVDWLKGALHRENGVLPFCPQRVRVYGHSGSLPANGLCAGA